VLSVLGSVQISAECGAVKVLDSGYLVAILVADRGQYRARLKRKI